MRDTRRSLLDDSRIITQIEIPLPVESHVRNWEPETGGIHGAWLNFYNRFVENITD